MIRPLAPERRTLQPMETSRMTEQRKTTMNSSSQTSDNLLMTPSANWSPTVPCLGILCSASYATARPLSKTHTLYVHTYGRYNGAALATWRPGCKARLQSSTQIGVQPLAVARRKVPLGGRRRLRLEDLPNQTTQQGTAWWRRNADKLQLTALVSVSRPSLHWGNPLGHINYCVSDRTQRRVLKWLTQHSKHDGYSRLCKSWKSYQSK